MSGFGIQAETYDGKVIDPLVPVEDEKGNITWILDISDKNIKTALPYATRRGFMVEWELVIPPCPFKKKEQHEANKKFMAERAGIAKEVEQLQEEFDRIQGQVVKQQEKLTTLQLDYEAIRTSELVAKTEAPDKPAELIRLEKVVPDLIKKRDELEDKLSKAKTKLSAV
jgi:hypothetical protein